MPVQFADGAIEGRISSHNLWAIVHSRNKWETYLFSLLHRLHQWVPKCVCLRRLSLVEILFRRMVHINNLVLGGALTFQRCLHQSVIIRAFIDADRAKYPSLGEYWPFFGRAHMISSSPSKIRMWAYVRVRVKSCQCCIHTWGMFKWWAYFQACYRNGVFSKSTICAIYVMFCWLRCWMRSMGSQCIFPHPTHG